MAWMHRDHAQGGISRLGSAQHRLEIAGAIVYRAAMLQKFIFALAIGAGCASVAMAEPRSGIDIPAIDPSVRPQDDFWQFANGKWLAATSIPADRAAWDTFSALRETNQQQLRDVIEAIDPRSLDGGEPRKLADFYGSFMDEARVEATGLDGLRDELRRIHALSDKAALPELFAHLSRLSVRIPWGLEIGPDERDATRYVAHLDQSRLGLPDRDYYLKDDAHFQAIRTGYRDHIVKLLALAGEPAAETSAGEIIALETRLARLQWTRVENRDPLKTYNKRDIAALPALTTKDDWPSFLSAGGVGTEIRSVVVAQPSYFDGVGEILREVPLATWQAYLAYNLLSAYAPYLSAPFVAEEFAFEQHTLRGVPEIQPRWKRAVAMVDRLTGFALGRLYVERYFPPANKARADAMIANLTAAYRESIATLDWMGPETRREALAKLKAIVPKIAYPTIWRDYSGLVIRRDDLVGNVMRAPLQLRFPAGQARPRSRPRGMAHHAADGQRILQRQPQRDCVSRRHPAAAVLRRRGRRRRQLRRHRLGDRPRDQSCLRRPWQPVRWRRQFAQLVDRRRSYSLRRQNPQPGGAVRRLQPAARSPRQWRADAGGERRR